MQKAEGEWRFCRDSKQIGKIIGQEQIWGESIYSMWFPEKNIVVRTPADRLCSLFETKLVTSEKIAYLTAAARVTEALTQNILLAPIESSVIPLPHQIYALQRAMSQERVRYLLADEVGLGKTIEAGLIMRELKLRGLVKRILIVTPKGLTTQWVSEMKLHFGEEFQLFLPGDFSTYRFWAQEENLWQSFSQVICPIDSVKPMERRRGWSWRKIAHYNRERFDDLVAAGWDLIVIDEAHRLGGSSDQVARFKLGQGLSQAAPYFLLLSATPHQGKSDAFHRLLTLLDTEAFVDLDSVTHDRVQAYTIRTEKRQAIDSEGKALFLPRRTQLVPISWGKGHDKQKLLYEALTEYVRLGYNRALEEKKSYIGFLMILMQRLVASSTQAIRTTLERRLEALSAPSEQLSLFPLEWEDNSWEDLDSQEQLEIFFRSRLKAFRNERSEVKLLFQAAQDCASIEIDVKAEALLQWIYQLQQEEKQTDLKVLIFTEFVPSQEMLQDFLSQRGFSVVCLNGSMSIKERLQVQKEFAQKTRILISTDAGGEGLNLQFCHVVINYDLPWNPMRLEQRIGRVDRIGQKNIVRVINLVLEDTVEYRVRQVLEEKLLLIQNEFGIDKTSDVLDSTQAEQIFDDLYMQTIVHPENLMNRVKHTVEEIQKEFLATQKSSSVLGKVKDLKSEEARRLLNHPLPHWLERMTTFYLRSHGGKVEKKEHKWQLTWPDGEEYNDIVFLSREAQEDPTTRQLTLGNERVLHLTTCLPRFVSGQAIALFSISGISSLIRGFWSLWSISLRAEGNHRQRIMPLFCHDDGRCLFPTARHIWDQMLAEQGEIKNFLKENSEEIFQQSWSQAQSQGAIIYEELAQEYHTQWKQEKEKGEYAFSARKKAVNRLGLPEVRNHRLCLLSEEEHKWRKEMRKREKCIPELFPLIILRIEGEEQ